MFPNNWLVVLLVELTSWSSDLLEVFWKIFNGSKTLKKVTVKSWYSVQIQKKYKIIKQLPVKFHSINPCRNWGLKPEILLKKRQVFSYESSEIFKNTFFFEHLWWLLLSLIIKLQYGGIGSFWDFCIFGLIFLFIY